MAKIAVILEEDFEDSEFKKPVEAFKKHGHETVLVGVKKGKVVKGKKEKTPATIEQEAGSADIEEFDALLIPGGYSPDHLRMHEGPIEFIKQFLDSGKPIFCICHGAQLLISADGLKGRKLTGWKSIKQDIKNAGGHFEDKEVVIDDNLITSRSPDDLPAFCEASLKKLKEI